MTRTQAITEIITNIGGIKRSLHGQTYSCTDGTTLTTSQLGLLFIIKREGALSAHALADRLALTAGAISQTVDSLLEGGFITRTPQPDNRRTFDLQLSDMGAKKLAVIERERYHLIEQATAELTDEELTIFVTSVQKILKAMQSNYKLNK